MTNKQLCITLGLALGLGILFLVFMTLLLGFLFDEEMRMANISFKYIIGYCLVMTVLFHKNVYNKI